MQDIEFCPICKNKLSKRNYKKLSYTEKKCTNFPFSHILRIEEDLKDKSLTELQISIIDSDVCADILVKANKLRVFSGKRIFSYDNASSFVPDFSKEDWHKDVVDSLKLLMLMS